MATVTHICDKPTPGDRVDIIAQFWGVDVGGNGTRVSDFDEYFAYYTVETSTLLMEMDDNWRSLWRYPVRSHQQMIEVVRFLQGHYPNMKRGETRQQIRSILATPSAEDSEVDSVINLALRLWLMINFRPLRKIGEGGGIPCVQWGETETLQKKMIDVFPKSIVDVGPSQRRLSPDFKMATMMRICGLQLMSTMSLEDHLRLDREKKVLWVFPCRVFLESKNDFKMRNTTHANSQTDLESLPIPAELLRETSRTLDLLFPFWDTDTKRLLKKMKMEHLLNPMQRSLDLKSYPYWKDRILEVYEDVYLAPPQGLSQLWRDRRDSQKFWTFWVALLVLFLTILSTFATVLQTYVALKALNHA